MTGRAKAITGIVCLIIGVIIIVHAYASLPDASACQTINQVRQSLGQAPDCSSSPSPAALITAAVFGGIGLLFLATSSRS